MNPALILLQDTLAKQNKAIRKRLVETDNEKLADALVTEMFEVSHRIQLAGGLLFAAQSQELDVAADKVRAAAAKVEKTIATVKNVKKLLDTTTDFLALVDEALDLAKSFML